MVPRVEVEDPHVFRLVRVTSTSKYLGTRFSSYEYLAHSPATQATQLERKKLPYVPDPPPSARTFTALGGILDLVEQHNRSATSASRLNLLLLAMARILIATGGAAAARNNDPDSGGVRGVVAIRVLLISSRDSVLVPQDEWYDAGG
ncbi:hypothetical protein CLCR_05234 [Cladophialophora carrionii]|uniref:Uncharacterized protein n=1 Tax=Cladophialophora carrionii TaxID=86049 RepID=A0A1C1CJP6_9EURO|nr:hypothetical protein CLCR_05234 [Cladophialophora carrionii]